MNIDPRFKTQQDDNIVSYPVPISEIVNICKELYYKQRLQLKIITATDERKNGVGFRILYIFGVPKENVFLVPYIILNNTEDFPSLTKDIPEASGYERKIKTFFGLNPIGHPNPKAILLHENWPVHIFPLRKDVSWKQRPPFSVGNYEFQKVDGEGIYEIPVGPVHAGIIEPGHFRFSVAGEEIILLEPKLGYKHKGIEKLFETLSLVDKVRLAERVSGDTSFTHALAFCQAIESLADINISKKTNYLRVIYSELERLANHFNDIGFIMLDTGYSFGGSNGARLREMIMQCNERLTGSRFLRGVNCIGGVTKDISIEACHVLLQDLKKIGKDFAEVMKIAQTSSTLFNRLEGTGKLDRQIALDYGVIGIAGRAIGIKHDARIDYPYAAYSELKFDTILELEGDVQSRFQVRVHEVQTSLKILEQALQSLTVNNVMVSNKEIQLRKNSCGIGVTEGWRGAIVYFVVTDFEGKVTRVDVRDPSFINWTVLGCAGKGNFIPDFPLINKSFNLSYSGNDL
ncbi:MAG: NADH-quinone oxidoreductase subunit C [Patescibacteria group bacterium]|jgi:Ni,Fe-hydrogenase III large subunit/Ni,Fe-hydrogenase III component G